MFFFRFTTDLSKVLPKLQKRISANSNNTSQNVDTSSQKNGNVLKASSEDAEPPLDFNDILLEKVVADGHVVSHSFRIFHLLHFLLPYSDKTSQHITREERSLSTTQLRQQQRASMSNSAHNSTNGNITVLVRNSLNNTVNNPEIEKLRTQDINPDENSAAYLALSAAAASAKGSSAAGSGHHGAGLDSEGELLVLNFTLLFILQHFVSTMQDSVSIFL